MYWCGLLIYMVPVHWLAIIFNCVLIYYFFRQFIWVYAAK